MMLLRGSTLALVMVFVGCAGDDDGGDGGGDGSGGQGCDGIVVGDSAGGFSSCVSAINQFPEGDSDIPEPYWIYSLVAAPEAGAELDQPLEALGINLFLAGAPAAGSFTLADGLSSTSAFVYAPYPTAYEIEDSLTLTVDEMQMVSEMEDFGGYPLISFTVHGSLEMTLASDGGDTVTVSASF